MPKNLIFAPVSNLGGIGKISRQRKVRSNLMTKSSNFSDLSKTFVAVVVVVVVVDVSIKDKSDKS